MKLLKKNISAKDGSGTVLLRPETSEDLWSAFNLIQKEDLVRCTTLRKVVKETITGSTSSQKKRMMLTVKITQVDFDPQVLQLRLSGTVTSESDNVRMGAHHTLTLELHQNFSIEKTCWDQIYLDQLQDACEPERQAEVAAVVMQPTGLAHICLITGSLTITKARIEVNIPKKRTGSSNHSKAITRFYEAVYRGLLQHIDFSQIKCVLVGSPGFVAQDFFQYLELESVKREDRPFIENKSKFVICKASSGHKHAIEELFADPRVQAEMMGTKYANEITELSEFMKTMEKEPDRAYYGFDHVSRANEELAIKSLLLTDELFRSSDVKTRRKYVDLVESVRTNGGTVYIFSSMHESGKQLQQVSGVAAVLRFPMPDLDELEATAERYRIDGGNAIEEEAEDDAEYDPEKRIREDVEDMGL